MDSPRQPKIMSFSQSAREGTRPLLPFATTAVGGGGGEGVLPGKDSTQTGRCFAPVVGGED